MKKLIILFIILLTSGCTIKYNITIDKNYITEDINMVIDNAILNETTYNELTSKTNNVYLNTHEYYKVNHNKDDNNLNVNYRYNHKINNYQNSKVINWCYHDKEIKIENNHLIIATGKVFDCANGESKSSIENAQINITTKLKVIENNADEVKDNTYTWNINKENYTNKPIKMNVELPKDNTALIKSTKETILIYAVFIVPIAILLLYLLWKKKKTNKI